MINKFNLILLFLLSLIINLQADSSSLSAPTAFINGVNVINGTAPVLSPGLRQEYYVTGRNDVGGLVVQLTKGDFRLGRVKLQRMQKEDKSWETIARFFYYADYTEVFDASNHKTIYRYNKAGCLTAIEQYTAAGQLYRAERLFWETINGQPALASRILEDAEHRAYSCHVLTYGPQGQLIKETLYGNLSGGCEAPLLIDASGYPQPNGIESYSIFYTYSPDKPNLPIKRQEENGLITHYLYDLKTEQQTGKLIGNQLELFTRYFYVYDNQGFLTQTIIDDGQEFDEKNWKGATARQVLKIQSQSKGPAAGQPLLTESVCIDLSNQTELALEKIAYSYSPEGRLLQQDFYDAEGELRYDLRMYYDANGQLLASADSRGEVASSLKEPPRYRVNESQQKVASIDRYGNEVNYFYDEFGRLIKAVLPAILDASDHPYRPSVSQEYNILNQMIKRQDANGHVTCIQYNLRSKPVQILYPDGSQESFRYYLDGCLKEHTAKNGRKTIFERDAIGRITRQQEYALSGECLRTLVYQYKGPRLLSITDQETFTATYQYDLAGRQIGLLHQTKEGTKRTEWGYDETGQRTTTKEWFGPGEEDFILKFDAQDNWQQTIETRFEDAQGEIQKTIERAQTKQEQPTFLFSQELTFLNDRGQYVRQQECIDGYGIRQLITYDALNRMESLVKLSAFGSKLAEQHMRYDGNGNKMLERHVVIIKEKPVRTFTIKWAYDALNRLISITEGLETQQPKSTYYQYNLIGQLETLTKPDGTTLIHQYDENGRLSHLISSDHSVDYAYHYDTRGHLIMADDHLKGISVSRRYDDLDQLREEEWGPGLHIKHAYDLAGRRVQLTLPDASQIFYRYQALNLASIERLSADQTILYQADYQYDFLSGRLLGYQLIGGIGSLRYQYDQQGFLRGIQSDWWSETIADDELDAYGYLKGFSIKDAAGTYHSSLTYTDDHHQLGGESSHTKSNYEYDSLYNRIICNGESWGINEHNQVTQTNGLEYHYDANGNLIKRQDASSCDIYEYDALNRLTKVIRNQQEAVEYTYDVFQRRLAQTFYRRDRQQWILERTEYFLYDGHREIGRANAQGQIIELRVLGIGQGAEIGSAIALELSTGLFSPIHNHCGSISCLVDVRTGQMAECYRYTAYGVETILDANGQVLETSEIDNPWRFSSKRHDAFTGFVFFGKRYYDAQLGRWTSPDPMPFLDTANVYAFVKNDPYNHNDLYGLFSIKSIWNQVVETIKECVDFIFALGHDVCQSFKAVLKFPEKLLQTIERTGYQLLGESIFLLTDYDFEKMEVGIYGQGELHDKVRVTFINGILTSQNMLVENLDMISRSHGGMNVHYVFRPTEGWAWDVLQGFAIKTTFCSFGFRSVYAHLLANMWKSLIQEMGGAGGGGLIIHYAHSLGGSDTDRARELLTPEEQKMIRIISFGSATMIANKGFESVINYVSLNDGIPLVTDPIGLILHLFQSDTNIVFKSHLADWNPYPFCDHFFCGDSYRKIIDQLGAQFIREFSRV